MKKILALGVLGMIAGLLAIVLFSLVPATASPTGVTGFYVGADAMYDGARYDGKVVSRAPNALYGVNLYGGWQIFQGIALEGGYTGRFSNASLSSATTQGVFGQAVAHIPVTSWLDLDGAFGVNYMATNVHITDFGTFKGFSWGWRLAAGPEFTIQPQMGWRTMVGYEQGGLGHLGSGGDVTLQSGLVWHL